jgi:hypothetical protein
MGHPLFEAALKMSIGSINPDYGYLISQTDEVIKHALEKAQRIANKACLLGAETREWSEKAHLETRKRIQLLRDHKWTESSQELRNGFSHKKIWEMNKWEAEIQFLIKNFMNESTELTNQLKTMNPPLKTEHLRPLINMAEQDRNHSVLILSQLTKSLDELAALKSYLREGRLPIFAFQPAP